MLGLFFSDDISYISIIIFVLMLLAMLWLVTFIYRSFKYKSPKESLYSKTDFDGIQEGNSDVPIGLHIGMGLVIIFGIWYVGVGYPLSKKIGAMMYEEEVATVKQQVDEKFANAGEDLLIQMGESVFNANCSICHGLNGRGLGGIAANLVEFGTEDHIIYTIKNGSKGYNKVTPIMPAQWALLGADDKSREKVATNIAAYVLSLSGRFSKVGNPALGKPEFERICAACHSVTGRGEGPLSDIPNFAANLTEYGKTSYIQNIVKSGKDGIIGLMPSFDEIGTLSDTQIKAVSLYVEKSLRNR